MGRMINRRRVYGGKKGLLPSGYTQLEYLENTRGAYINTGVVVNTLINPRIVVTWKMINSGDYDWWGTQNVNTPTIIWNFKNNYQYAWFVRWGTTKARYTSFINQQDLSVFDFTDDFHTLDVGGVDINQQIPVRVDGITVALMNSLDASLANTYPILIFRGRNDTALSQNKVFKIYSNGILLRDYIPAIRNSDNVAGMYDLVNNIFYTNAGTEGTFIAGPEV